MPPFSPCEIVGQGSKSAFPRSFQPILTPSSLHVCVSGEEGAQAAEGIEGVEGAYNTFGPPAHRRRQAGAHTIPARVRQPPSSLQIGSVSWPEPVPMLYNTDNDEPLPACKRKVHPIRLSQQKTMPAPGCHLVKVKAAPPASTLSAPGPDAPAPAEPPAPPSDPPGGALVLNMLVQVVPMKRFA
ncbi:hypothetical protein FB451DRAFT_1196197 [Mycena latifolia]|nr:hypothetical protein FB451DRAFT_1196197 [Mycena latifolia]